MAKEFKDDMEKDTNISDHVDITGRHSKFLGKAVRVVDTCMHLTMMKNSPNFNLAKDKGTLNLWTFKNEWVATMFLATTTSK